MLRRHSTPGSLKTLCGLLLCAMVTLSAAAQHVKTPKKNTYKQVIAQLENTWLAAQRANDAATIDKLLSDDYIGISSQGMVSTKAQTLARMQSRQVVVNELNVKDQKISVHGDTAVVTSQVEFDATNNTTQPPMHIHSKLRYTRVYLHYPSGSWRIVNFEATHISDMPGSMQPPPAAAPEPAAKP